MTLDEAIGELPLTVEITNPETPFGGVQVYGLEIPVQIVFQPPGGTGGGGGGGDIPTTDLVTSVFTRVGDVVALDGDYRLDQIDPPVANFTLAGKLRIKADGSFQLWNPDQGKWHSLEVHGTAGAEYITISAGES